MNRDKWQGIKKYNANSERLTISVSVTAARGLLLAAGLWGAVGASAAWAVSYDNQLSFSSHYYKYSETNSKGGPVMAIDGPMFGGHYRGRLNFDGGLFIDLVDISVYGSNILRYTSPVSGTRDNVVMLLVENRALLGYHGHWSDGGLHNISFYTGGGYRYTSYYGVGKYTTKGAASYNRFNHMGYVPFGINYSFQKDQWLVGLQGEYDFFIGGRQESHFDHRFIDPNGLSRGEASSVNPWLNKQRNGYGMKFNLVVGYAGWFINPFINYWQIEASDFTQRLLPLCNFLGKECDGGKISSRYEPANKTIEVGARIGYAF